MAVRKRERDLVVFCLKERRASPSSFSPLPKKKPNKKTPQVACLAAILPLALYVGCQDEFSPEINPCSPSGYLVIARRTFAAFGSSESGKVTGKDL